MGLAGDGRDQLVDYLAEARRMLGAVPTQDTLVVERFFDESGGMQLVLHAPFGSRINRAWGLALRKRFCRSFDFELQAAANEDAIVLSLGPQHSFPLESVFDFLHPDTVRDVLVQALLDAPMFGTRWRWNATTRWPCRGLAAGKQGAAADPADARRTTCSRPSSPTPAACLENIPGDREVPDHPLVRQTIDDCLHEAMDLDGLIDVLRDRRAARSAASPATPRAVAAGARDPQRAARTPSSTTPRWRSAAPRRCSPAAPSSPRPADDLGALDPAAIERVREEAWPEARTRTSCTTPCSPPAS